MDSYSDSEYAESECELENSDCEYSDNYEGCDFEVHLNEEIKPDTNNDDSTGVPQHESIYNTAECNQHTQWDGDPDNERVGENDGCNSTHEDFDSDSDDDVPHNGVIQHQQQKEHVNRSNPQRKHKPLRLKELMAGLHQNFLQQSETTHTKFLQQSVFTQQKL